MTNDLGMWIFAGVVGLLFLTPALILILAALADFWSTVIASRVDSWRARLRLRTGILGIFVIVVSGGVIAELANLNAPPLLVWAALACAALVALSLILLHNE